MDDYDKDLLYLLVFVVFFPWSLIYLIGRWIVQRAKRRAWGYSYLEQPQRPESQS